MKGYLSKFGSGMMYRFPTASIEEEQYKFSLTLFDQGDKLIFQGYSLLPNDHLQASRGKTFKSMKLTPDPDRFVLSVKKGVHLYKINKHNLSRPLYQYNMLDTSHFEGFIDIRLGHYGMKAQSYYNWLCKFTYKWLKRNHVAIPKMRFGIMPRHKGRQPESLYMSRLLQYAVYPMVKDMYMYEGIPFLWGRPKELSPYLRKHRSIRALTKGIFGYSSTYLVDVVKRTMTSSAEHRPVVDYIKLGIALKGMIPVDYWPRIGQVLDQAQMYSYQDTDTVKALKEFFKQYPQERILAILTSTYKDVNYQGTANTKYAIRYLYDTLRNWYQFRDKINIPKDIVNLSKLHDFMSIEYRKLQSANHEIKIPREYSELQGKMIHNMSILLPKQTHDLIEWGQTMHNCIGGYGESIRSGRTMCMALLKEGKMTYNLEIRNKQVIQFHAYRNHQPDPNDEKIVRSYLQEQKVIA